MAPAMLASMVAAKRCLSKGLSASDPPASPNASTVATATRNTAGPSPGTAAHGASQGLIMSRSTLNSTRLRPSAATALTARPTANATRESLPGCMSARPRAERTKAPEGLMAGKPGPQLDSSGGLRMTTTREALPEQVRIQVLKMRDLVRTIENAPLNEVVAAIENLKAEIDTLMAHAMEASGAQTQELATAVEEQRKQVEARTEQRLNDLIDKHRRGNTKTTFSRRR